MNKEHTELKQDFERLLWDLWNGFTYYDGNLNETFTVGDCAYGEFYHEVSDRGKTGIVHKNHLKSQLRRKWLHLLD